jgi:gamma-glutamylputrescine oxidase
MTAHHHPLGSYYAATANDFIALHPLKGDVIADVCVIGGGFTGLSAALHLAERGYKVVLLEAAQMGWGASGRNGGQINTGLRKSPQDLIAAYGLQRAKALFDFSEEARALIRDRVSRHQIDCDLKAGTMLAASKRSDLGWMEEEIRCFDQQMGYHKAQLLDRAAARQIIGSDLYHGAINDSGGGHLHPLNYALGLATAAIAAGAALYDKSTVTAIDTVSGGHVVHAGQGQVRATYVVLGCNAYLGDLEPRIAGKIMPIANYIIGTEPLSEAEATSLIANDACVCDTKFVVSYYRLSADRRLLFGGGEKYSPAPPRDIADFVTPYMLRVYPQLKGKRIDYGWGGMLAITVNRLPHIGRQGNLFYAHGYSGQGVATTGIAGKLIAEAVAGTAERFDVFAGIKHQTFPGGTLLRHPLLVLAMLWYALRDRL